jgi:hypothetical protein
VKTPTEPKIITKQEDVALARAAIGRYTNYRFNHLPFLFGIPLSALANGLLPHGHYRIALAMLIGFGVGIPLGELSRFVWLRVFRRSRSQ